ncbi:hypothetical protein CNMCM6936_007998 [Aspergillus lentulus]|uniref:Zn(2)-C6 fungal-type domain-containing protein n=1 Tax=Aspergillus lentulus TaxID=293939 RepID=A0AAN6BS19_ASPLE|nr:hypothetical protein CNMCM6069_004539 [Aspergillus lentulus]KAF4165296.1 hypothetical protein CNMCM6936_007998 [Aspergillus lentulus]KAF4176387.1 hypothetical protein CNMCM8060_006376 [Aspergillus lentulus]KAF4194559.1 hypothetical protein CNMCM8694_007367 [Aspergillus lentulus]KAF4206823.1 hypothetical protein CNMCM8927_004390 [Aspergillus lentulus]
MNRRKNTQSAETDESSKRRKFIACQRCHAHKIKCSGEQPCAKCRMVGCADECTYTHRDRQVKVSESYLESLISENRRLKEQSTPSANPAEPTHDAEASESRLTEQPDESNTSVRNPLIGDRAWFHPYDPSAPPIFIGEAACTAFATRFRRFLTGSNTTPHIPRMQYVKEANIAAANEVYVQWPSLQQARLLVKIVLRQIGCLYHLLLRKSTLEKLEEIYRTGDFDCKVNQCKFFALFAFGEAYSIRTEPLSGSRVPGTSYFARALSLVQSLTHSRRKLTIKSLFSYYLNRRHSAYVLIGSAMRLSLQIGLNHNIPESQLIDPVERQHRVRIWWTIYIFDRMWGSKMGMPSQILDDDIHVDMPSKISPAQLHDEQFSDPDYQKANIELARIVGETIAKLYSRRKYSETFLQRVQKLLKALKNWIDTLPDHLRLNENDPEMNTKHISSLHLAFNQCVILTTRPTLLHLLIKVSESDTTPTSKDNTISQPVWTLGEACIHAARHSHSLILTRYINGSVPVFGYFHAHYLFSASLVLAMSSLLPIGSRNDLGAFETGLAVLQSMSENGNLAASEFYQNLEQVKYCLERYGDDRRRKEARRNGAEALGPGNIPAPSVVPTQPHTDETAPLPPGPGPIIRADNELNSSPGYNGYGNLAPGVSIHEAAVGLPTAVTFLEPTMQDFLAQSDFDLGLLHSVDTFMNDTESMYTSHGL